MDSYHLNLTTCFHGVKPTPSSELLSYMKISFFLFLRTTPTWSKSDYIYRIRFLWKFFEWRLHYEGIWKEQHQGNCKTFKNLDRKHASECRNPPFFLEGRHDYSFFLHWFQLICWGGRPNLWQIALLIAPLWVQNKISSDIFLSSRWSIFPCLWLQLILCQNWRTDQPILLLYWP